MEKIKGRTLYFLVTISLLFFCLNPFWITVHAQSSGAVDVVIVLDKSASMKDARPYSDEEGYRYDAAAVMLNMCEVTGSRAAVIYFDRNTTVLKLKDQDNKVFSVTKPENIALLNTNAQKDVEGGRNRNTYVEKLNEDAKNNPNSGSTFLGTAMLKAVEIMDAGASTRNGNQPIILVLADGNNDPGDNDNLQKATRDCEAKGYRVFTVLLKNKDNTEIKLNDAAYNAFRELATKTGGKSYDLADPAKLPAIFNEIFASQIGSTLIERNVKSVRNTDGTSSIEIHIPNKSVVEANILMQKQGMSEIRLLNPADIEAAVDNVHLFHFTTHKFEQYKIFKPQFPGLWHINYLSGQDEPDSISVSILFSYNVELQGTILNAGTFYKNTPIQLSAQFLDGGYPAQDNLLYSGGIKCNAYLVPQGKALDDSLSDPHVELDAKGDRFEKTLTLGDFGLDRSGDYELIFRAEGDGLVRESTRVPFKVDNQAPIELTGKTPKSIPMLIEDPNAADINADSTYSLDLSSFISDLDGDRLIPQIKCDNPAVIELVDTDTQDLSIELKTSGTVGTANIIIQVVDNEGAQLASTLSIPVVVTSIKDELQKAYKPVITLISPANEEGFYEKGETVSFRVNIEKTGTPAFDIADYNPEINTISVKGDQMTGLDVPVEMKLQAATVYTGELKLSNSLMDYVIKTDLTAGNGVQIGSDEEKFSTGNVPPVPVESVIRKQAYIEAVKFLGQEDTEPWTADLNTLFTDKNINDRLTFEISATAEDGKEPFTVTHDKKKNLLTLSPVRSGKQSFIITAIDTSGEKAACAYEVEVISQRETVINQVIRYGLYILAAVILLLIIWYILKPSFKGMLLTRLRDGNNYMESKLPATKAKLSLGQYADTVMLDTVGLKKEQLMKIRLKAGKRCIHVLRGKVPLGAAVLTVGSVPFSKKNKKKLRLENGREIRIENNQHTVGWRLGLSSGGGRKPASGPARPGYKAPQRPGY